MIRVYGQQEGTKRFNQYRQKQAYTNSLQYKKEKYGWSQEQFKKYNKSRAVTLDLCIQRHGIQKGTKIFQDYCQKQAYSGCKLQYFQQKYGMQQGTKIFHQIGKNKTHSLQNYIKWYGQYDGLEKWKERGKCYSKISQQLFNQISQKLSQKSKYFMYPQAINSNNQLQFELNINNKFYFIDFYDKETKRAIEFYGEYWHASPEKYNYNDTVNLPGKQLLAQEIWKKDQKRINLLLQTQEISQILIVWQQEYKNNPEEILNKCIQFLTK